ncbi:MAG TPA: glycosyltransferase [Nocardioidaceae bacterium]|nr:glycosyltransferase [Nocardioidaceae bacterium]
MTALGADPVDEGRLAQFLQALLRSVVVVYAVGIFYLVWLGRELTFAVITDAPAFAIYSLAVMCYVLGRFVIAFLYRPIPDRGHRPTITVIVPAFNEEDGITGTIESIVNCTYPAELVEILVVNDGSSDDTWRRMVAARERWPQVRAIDLGANYGKRAAMAEGIRRSTGTILAFVDSDSYLAPGALIALAAPFVDQRVGAVVGHAEVRNRHATWVTKMQQVRYFAAFRVIKGAESRMSGTVTCASGCCAAYRRDIIEPFLRDWEFQSFLGRPATFGDDRALTNRILRHHRVVYQTTARAETNAPTSLRVFFRQQLRWKKSWLRESTVLLTYFWRKNPLASLFTYASILFPIFAPFVVLHAVLNAATGNSGTFWFYVIGSYAMALLYSLYYAFSRRDGLWFHGLTFIACYMCVLVFQTYWAMLTMRDTRWGTRDSTVEHKAIDPLLLTDLLPAASIPDAAVVPAAESRPALTGVR